MQVGQLRRPAASSSTGSTLQARSRTPITQTHRVPTAPPLPVTALKTTTTEVSLGTIPLTPYMKKTRRTNRPMTATFLLTSLPPLPTSSRTSSLRFPRSLLILDRFSTLQAVRVPLRMQFLKQINPLYTLDAILLPPTLH